MQISFNFSIDSSFLQGFLTLLVWQQEGMWTVKIVPLDGPVKVEVNVNLE